MSKSVIVVGTGNAALCAAIAALEKGASVTLLEKADEALAGGNTKYTAGAMRFAYDGAEDLLALLCDPADPRIAKTDFGSYTAEKFGADLLGFNDGRPLSLEQQDLIAQSGETMRWLASHDVTFEPIYSRQSFKKAGRHVFWGGLTLAARNEGVGLFEMELAAVRRLGGTVRYNSGVTGLITQGDSVVGVQIGNEEIRADAVILASGGFEANEEMRVRHMGPQWQAAKVRGTPHNTGDGLRMALDIGAAPHGFYAGGHATPMDLHMADFGGLHLPPGERKNYRKISYFLGVMLNAQGRRFVDEGANFRNYTYAQYGAAILEQPGQFAWQVFDSKVFDLLYAEYRFHDAHFIEANTLEELVNRMDGVDAEAAMQTLMDYNNSVNDEMEFDPTTLDGKATQGITPPKTNWAQKIDQGPFRAFPVTGGITFTYGGLRVDDAGNVMGDQDKPIPGLFACGELVGGVFFAGYPGGSGLTSGAVFGRRAGYGAAR
ncbi:FAD-dependent tricarballylate dehydrogenase TcuA [Sulfitobacter aestuariivivens]|uniref:FAD-dependent tricarballylate dehydrogenase TcuA n=1 Tax=Sulfitobacter aestuariivivens TaxID=2766981 RepID=A0A927D9L2_9RHOB|nr:FAD-dependent tricarballylate dehydrogenase TcuA [Sulfitobacter aestuariivivens]MBD3666269.1 FAD-dependent tricarballylate dehydrogenase TcuA [Sulfitobacter aestuariivivens]